MAGGFAVLTLIFDLVMYYGLESAVLSHLWNKKLMPTLMITLIFLLLPETTFKK